MASTMPTSAFYDDPKTHSYPDAPAAGAQRRLSSATASATHLSPFSPFEQSSTTSPDANNTDTPADSISSLNSHYEASDYSDFGIDPFFGVDFSNAEGGTPSFMEGSLEPVSRTSSFGETEPATSSSDCMWATQPIDSTSYPFSPMQTASIHTLSPPNDQRGFSRPGDAGMPDSVSPQDLQRPFQSPQITLCSGNPAFQLTPDPSRSGRSSEDDLVVQGRPIMPPSPRVTVSLWEQGDAQPTQAVERTFTLENDSSPANTRYDGLGLAGDLIFSQRQAAAMPPPPPPRGDNGIRRTASVGRHGLDPRSRPNTEIDSVNEMVRGHEIQERNHEVALWFDNLVQSPPPDEPSRTTLEHLESQGPLNSGADDGIAVGGQTENRRQHNQLYFNEQGGELNQTDFEMLRENMFGDAPTTHAITQPSTPRFENSNAAIADYHRRLFDNASIASKAATWGTRRLSLPNVLDSDDAEKVTSGSLFKKFSISRGRDRRRPSLLEGLQENIRGMVRRRSVSQMLKRNRNSQEDEDLNNDPPTPERQESFPRLTPLSRASSINRGSKKASVPSLNTAIVSMSNGVAAIGSTHARSGSISATPKSPKPIFTGLQVKNTLQRRPRSKSDLPKGSSEELHPNLVGMWRRNGGPPVATLGTAADWDADDDDEEEDDEAFGDCATESESSKLIAGVSPTFAGFQQHILNLNPGLKTDNKWLVDRIAQQQVIRYKLLLGNRVKHLQVGGKCSCRALCQALGGSARLLDAKGGPRALDPMLLGAEHGDVTPIEGVVTQESFPQDIPMPPTQSLPAEFECQLCFQVKKLKKPSDWTKHVHEDVQPFTCTWEKCKEQKTFKRKADWVRHENEGHRHLEWWTCDVEDCRHTCYRRDNFLQHLVREHKFIEPAVKTKAAVKRAGGIDPTWQRVERCHTETEKKPQHEPCRFCSKTFPSWKKLTVHLAKHMEQLSLPVLRLVAKKDLDPDTIISPVQDPPPGQLFNALPGPFASTQFDDFGHNLAGAFATSNFSFGELATHVGPYVEATDNMTYPSHEMNHTHGRGYIPNPGIASGVTPTGFVDHGAQLGYHQGHHTRTLSVPSPTYPLSEQQYISNGPGLEMFPTMDQNALGLQLPHTMAVQGDNVVPYEVLMAQGNGDGPAFMAHSTSSTYTRSPSRGRATYYTSSGA